MLQRFGLNPVELLNNFHVYNCVSYCRQTTSHEKENYGKDLVKAETFGVVLTLFSFVFAGWLHRSLNTFQPYIILERSWKTV